MSQRGTEGSDHGGKRRDCRGSVGVHYKLVVLSGLSGRHVRFGGFMFEGLFQPMHLLVIFFIALLVFGPKKLPELGKGLGEGIRALKEGMKDHDTKTDAKTEIKTDIKPENKA
jgi:sec-independent protein translocase protein TatA